MKTKAIRKLLGIKGIYLAICRSLHWKPAPMVVPIFGRISTLPETLNIYDNFGLEELRDKTIEQALKDTDRPLVIDCGVNVGITVRWWLYLNPRSKVIGIDMLKEPLDFTRQALNAGPHPENSNRFCGLTGTLYSTDQIEFEIAFDNPLEGDNSLFNGKRDRLQKRKLKTVTLDNLLRDEMSAKVTLIKIDLEGAGGKALAGAINLLARTNHVVFESHNAEEMSEASRILFENGFVMRRATNRNTWWKRKV
jgi:FkbM family methyltransferase